MRIFKSIAEYYREINVPPARYPFFDIRRHEENIATLKEVQSPVRHELYSISVFTEMDAQLNLNATAVKGKAFIISPLKAISWSVKNKNIKGWYILFDRTFIANYPFWKNFQTDFDFFNPDTNFSFDLPEPILEDILYLLKKIHAELHSSNEDKFQLIATYTNLVLLTIKRHLATHNHAALLNSTDDKLALVSKFQTLLEASIAGSKNNPVVRKPSYYAKELSIHPNYLNALVKMVAGKTASQLIAGHLITQAKIAIRQEKLSIKEASWRLHFSDPGNFITFFKKYTGITPRQYRLSTDH